MLITEVLETNPAKKGISTVLVTKNQIKSRLKREIKK
jgi:hypothetical protein